MSFLWFKLALILQLLATGGFIVYLINPKNQIVMIAYWVLFAGFISHGIYLGCQYHEFGAATVLSFKSALSFFSWTIICAFLIFQAKFRLMVLGSFVAPFSSVLMILSTTIPQANHVIRPEHKDLWLTIHIGTAFMGDGLFALAFLTSIMYLLMDYAIKQKKFGSFYHRLPSLATTDAINYHALIYGFTFLTIGMITGSIYAQNTLGSFWQWDPKEVWSPITWFCYAALIHERAAIGWRGRKAAWMAIICFFILVLTFVGSALWMGGYHSFNNLGVRQL